jgi:hypothetical protein
MHACHLTAGPVRWFFAASIAVLLTGPFARAGAPPLVEFDAPFSLPCRSLPLRSPAPGDLKELIEVVIPISARLRAGAEKDLRKCLYTMVDPARPETLAVTDLLPQTQLKTEFAKPIQVNQEHLAKVGINLSAHYVVAATADAMGQLKSGLNYEMLPPQEIVLASGTTQYGHGVFFELKPSTQTTLEGVKSFSVIFAVPRGWRAGCLRLECEAVGLDRGVVPPFDREVSSGRAVFYLALHLAGDGPAERLADDVARCQQVLLESLARHRLDEGRHAFPWHVKPIGTLPRLFDKPWPPEDTLPSRAELTLLDGVLDRTKLLSIPNGEFPPPVLEKWSALQAAAEALQSLSVGRPSARDQAGMLQARPAATAPATCAAAVDNVALRVNLPTPGITPFASLLAPATPDRAMVASEKRAERAAAEPPKSDARTDPAAAGPPGNSPAMSPVVMDKTTLAVAGVPGVAPTGSAGKEGDGPAIKPNQPSRVGGAVAPGAAGDAKVARPGPAINDVPAVLARLPPAFSNQSWYLLASVLGTVFTCIVAPLVVEIIRRRMK